MFYMPWKEIERDEYFGSMKIQKLYRFEGNNYGASVIQGSFTYGYKEGLWELAVIKFNGEDWHLCMDTPITDDVIGYLTEKQVQDLLGKIDQLQEES